MRNAPITIATVPPIAAISPRGTPQRTSSLSMPISASYRVFVFRYSCSPCRSLALNDFSVTMPWMLSTYSAKRRGMATNQTRIPDPTPR